MEKLSLKLPEAFKKRMKDSLGESYTKYIDAVNSEPIKGLRVNTAKISTEEFEKRFTKKISRLSFSKDGYLLETNEKLGFSPEHLSGLIYLQEPSSMLAVCSSGIENEKRDLRVLDLCASPGGKSSQIASRISANSLLISNEVIHSRAETLYSNIERQGFKNVIVTNEEPENLSCFEGYFDYVFVDAPCSGEGMFRKNPETICEWSEDNVKMCQLRQKDILKQAEKLVASGGKLVYSTCTFSREEDEDIIDWFIENFNFELTKVPDEVEKVTIPAKTRTNFGCARKFFPYFAKGEGQFVAVLKCKDESRREKLHTKKHFHSIERAGKSKMKLFNEFAKEYLTEIPSGTFFEVGKNLYLLPNSCGSDLQTALDNLKFVSLGVKLGSVSNDRFEPNHALFMAFGELFKQKFELSDVELKKYLHGEELQGGNFSKGYGVVTSGGFAIGGVRISQNKLKNLYPKGLRV